MPERNIVTIEEVVRRVEKLEDSDKRHEGDIKQLYVHQEGTKAYVTQILNKLDSLETKLFNALTAQNVANSKEQKDWKELIKYIIGVTFGLAIGYLFYKGAK